MNPSLTHTLEKISLMFLRASILITECALRYKSVLNQAKEIGLIGAAAGLAFILGRVVGHFLQAFLT